jgi:spermidine/putrescine transport system permease protein
MVGRIAKRIYLYIIFLFLYAPIVVLVVYSFNESKSRGHWGGFTLKWYRELLRDREIAAALYNTLMIAILSSIIATIIGTAAAIGIHNMKKIKKAVVMNLTYLPVLNPEIVTGVSLMMLFIFMSSFSFLSCFFLLFYFLKYYFTL